MQTASKIRGEVTFRQCFHVRYYQFPCPAVGDTIWCPDCKADRTVVTAPPSYRLSCNRCEFGGKQSSKASLDAALNNARRHVNSRKTHVVEVRNGSELVKTVEFGSESDSASGQSLATLARESQAVLRSSRNVDR